MAEDKTESRVECFHVSFIPIINCQLVFFQSQLRPVLYLFLELIDLSSSASFFLVKKHYLWIILAILNKIALFIAF